GVEHSRDERVPQRVRPNALGYSCLAGDATHHTAGGMTVEPLAGAVDEEGAFQPLADREVEGPTHSWRQRHPDDLPAFAVHGQGPMTSLEAERVDVCAEGFGDPQSVQRH